MELSKPEIKISQPTADDGVSSNRANKDVPTIISMSNSENELNLLNPEKEINEGRTTPNIRGSAEKLDFGVGTTIPELLESIPDINIYQHKKTIGQGMMDLALFSANASQLRYILDAGSPNQQYFWPGIVLIAISLFLQVAVGVGLIFNSRYNVKDDKEICIANKINNFTIIGIFLVTIINVFMCSFGISSFQTTTSPTGASPTITPPPLSVDIRSDFLNN